MTTPAPPIDKRTASVVTGQITTLIKAYAPAYTGAGIDSATGAIIPDPLANALIGIFGRFTELIIQRLNRVPDKNFLAFLDLLGAAQLPPQPARVPLTFSLAAGSIVPAVVPAGTQVAAPPGPGEKDPTIFETEHEFVVTPAALTAAFNRDPELDGYADLSALPTVAGASAQGAAIFRGERLVDHILYLGFRDLLGFMGIVKFGVTFGLTADHSEPRETIWEAWDGSGWSPVSSSPGGDATAGLSSSGLVDLQIGSIAPIPASTIQGVESRWVRALLETPINRSTVPRAHMVRGSELPVVQSIRAAVTVNRPGLSPDAAFTNGSAADTSKEFFPFGDTPRFGDTFYLRADEALSTAGASVVIHLDVMNPTGGTTTTPPPTGPSDDLKLSWELGNGGTWLVLGTSTQAVPTAADMPDGTQVFTRSGDVRITKVPRVSAATVNGVQGYWLRVRIVAGDYGKDARYIEDAAAPAGFSLKPADFKPPIVEHVTVSYKLNRSAEPDAALTDNDFTLADVSTNHDAPGPGGSFAPFVPMEDEDPTLYLGFALPPALTAFPNRPVSVFGRAAEIRYGERTVPLSPTRSVGAGLPGSIVTHRFTVTNPEPTPQRITFSILGTSWVPTPVPPPSDELAPGEVRAVAIDVKVPAATPLGARDEGLLMLVFSSAPTRAHVAAFETVAGPLPPDASPVELVWNYWNGVDWFPLTIQDGTNSLSQSGTVEFLAPPSFAARADFGLDARYWIRGRWTKGQYERDPRLVRLLLNTTMAAQTVTVHNEVLGSSDRSKSLRFRATRAPILSGQRLDVREPELPSAEERAAIEREEGADAVTITLDARGRQKDIFVRWHQVPDFYASGPRDRHYVLDRLTGEIRFGDGLNGLVPPIGIGNVRLTFYQTGGGSAGNRPAGTIVQLKTTVPYVDKVTNHEAATAGADAEPLDRLLARAPREVRHGGRAVTVEDYEDLAHLASPEVARAKCVPLANLATDPLSQPATPGQVSVIIVPRSAEAKPLPSLELIRRVEEYLHGVDLPTVHLSVVGPLYVGVRVRAEVGLVSLTGSTAVLAEIEQRVASFLHPLTGSLDGQGWDFGRRPFVSDFYALIEAVPGVDHVRSLDVDEVEDLPGVTLTGRFLVYSLTPEIGVIFEET